jgi:hypothetical protein
MYVTNPIPACMEPQRVIAQNTVCWTYLTKIFLTENTHYAQYMITPTPLPIYWPLFLLLLLYIVRNNFCTCVILIVLVFHGIGGIQWFWSKIHTTPIWIDAPDAHFDNLRLFGDAQADLEIQNVMTTCKYPERWHMYSYYARNWSGGGVELHVSHMCDGPPVYTSEI